MKLNINNPPAEKKTVKKEGNITNWINKEAEKSRLHGDHPLRHGLFFD